MNVMPCFVEGFVCPCRTTFFEGKFFCRTTGLLVWGLLSAQVPKSTNDLIAAMLSHEDYDAWHRGHFSYLSFYESLLYRDLMVSST
jgi:hypothetical protein